MEGGMVVTDDCSYAEMLKPLRAHGWIREMKGRDELIKKYGHIDSRFLFVNTGFNVRPTDLQGAFGIHQIGKLEDFIGIRRDNARYWNRELAKFGDVIEFQTERPGTRHVWFGFPITVRPGAPFARKELTDYLESKGIETRPVMAGNLAEQPAFAFLEHRPHGELKNARNIMRNSFFFGNHQNVGEAEREWIARCIGDFVSERVKR
jgi:CDP-6-deoxy-D-xylo-4-hexulose-3-dehydrase